MRASLAFVLQADQARTHFTCWNTLHGLRMVSRIRPTHNHHTNPKRQRGLSANRLADASVGESGIVGDFGRTRQDKTRTFATKELLP